VSANVTALVTDLIFSTKITSTAKSLDVPVKVVRSVDALAERLAAGDTALVLIDLHADGVDPIEAIAVTRRFADPPHTIAYGSHVQTDLAAAARHAGADEVLPRSAFTARLPEILKPTDAA
jgi:CheY-like chemotaxis protein